MQCKTELILYDLYILYSTEEGSPLLNAGYSTATPLAMLRVVARWGLEGKLPQGPDLHKGGSELLKIMLENTCTF